MKTLKRSLAVILSVLMLLSMLATTAMTVSADESTTVYFVNTLNWDEVYVHVWTHGGGANDTWPGVLANVVDAEKGVYSFDLGSHNRIIFNNNGKGAQTANLELEEGAGKYYNPKTQLFYSSVNEALGAVLLNMNIVL